MKNLKSLQAVALAGIAIAFTSGCSSTGYSEKSSSDANAAYRWVSSAGSTPITDVRLLGKFPLEWNPMVSGSYKVAVPVTGDATIASRSDLPRFSADIEPGEAYVEAAGGASDTASVRRVILYTPFNGTGLGH